MWSMPITNVTIEGYVTPWSCTDRSKAQIVCTKAEKDEIIVKVGEAQYSTKDGLQEHIKVGHALDQIMDHVLGEDYSGYLHNYKYANGSVYDGDEQDIDGYMMCG